MAVASRTASKAGEFAERHNLARTCTYDELLSAQDVDAVYIPVPTALAGEWAVRAAAAGKHVLVDKPFASANVVHEIITTCRTSDVIFLDGTHFVHSERTKEMLNLTRNHLGPLRCVTAKFSAPLKLKGDIRFDASLEPHGALGDLGWYCCRAAVVFLGVERTSRVSKLVCLGSVYPEAPDVVREASGVIVFKGGEKLIIDCSFETVLRMRAEVTGTKGCIRMNDFVVPFAQFDNPSVSRTDEITNEFELEIGNWTAEGFPSPSKRETKVAQEGRNGLQTVHMLKEFGRMIVEHDTNTAERRAQESLATQRLVDALHRECMRNVKQTN